MTMGNRRIAASGALCFALFTAVAMAQEETARQPGGLALAIAMEESLQTAIAKAEKSVVAIARLRHNHDAADIQLGDFRPIPFGLSSSAAERDPTHPDFVPTEFGTGIVIDRTGLILTTCDVIGDLEEHTSNSYYVTAGDRKVREAKIEAADPRSNLAVLKVDGSDLTPITFGDGAKLRKGQIVIALGNPYAIARDGQVSASWGIVSNLQRKAGVTPDETNQSGKSTLHHLGTLIQTDAKLNFGTSGGALLNLQGEMVGLTTAMAAAAGYEQAAGYAIPVDETFRRILNELRHGRAVQYGFLGVAPNLHEDARRIVQNGVLVQSVVRGAPADQSGIQAGDVILRVNGKPVYDFDSLLLHVGSQPPGGQVELLVDRAGREMPVVLTLAKATDLGKAIVSQPEPSWRGMRVDYWTATMNFREERELSQSPDFEGCVVVTEVAPGSPAAAAGLKPRMAITHVDGGRISTPREFKAAVESMTGAVKLRLAGPSIEGDTELVVAE
jgi:serine protease Do